MSSSKQNNKKSTERRNITQTHSGDVKIGASANTKGNYSDVWIMVLLSVITFLCYINSLQNQFIANWDDRTYIVENTFVKGLSSQNLKMLLFHCVTPSNYHPLTMLSLAINYYFSGLNPESYFLTNILIHIFNVLLVFLIAKKLFERTKIKGYVNLAMTSFPAALCGLFFGIHPMHVESVSWISERKDVLYAFFYFLGMLFYLRYEEKQTVTRMVPVIILFILSCLSKAMAVTFPLSLFAIDILLKRKMVWKLIVEKIPLLLISLFFGILAYYVQNKVTGVVFFLSFGYTVFNKLFIPFYSFLIYTVKAFFPFHLANYYPIYPLRAGKSLPLIYYVSPFIDAAIIGIPLYLGYRAGENIFRMTLFGIVFYLANLIFILQLLSVSSAIISERYTYIAYFGIFFMLIYLLEQLWIKYSAFHTPLLLVCTGFTGMFFYLCYERTKVWHYDETLWKDEISKYPDDFVPYQDLAYYYFEKKDTENALINYTLSAANGSSDPAVYNHLAVIYSGRRQFDKALSYYWQALHVNGSDTNYFSAYLNRGNTFAMMNKFDLALRDYNYAYKINPDTDDIQLLRNRAYACNSIQMYAPAIRDFTHIIRLHAANAYDYETRGWEEYKMGDAQAAVADCLLSLKMQPGNPGCFFNLSIIYASIKNFRDAYTCALKAKEAGIQVKDAYLMELKNKAEQ